MADQGVRTTSTGTRVAIEVLNGAGRAVAVEFTASGSTIEVRAAGRHRAVLDRGALRDWLTEPAGFHGPDDMIWARTTAGVAITITPVFPWWELGPRDLQQLRELI